jgi:hypothetical protein
MTNIEIRKEFVLNANGDGEGCLVQHTEGNVLAVS